MMEKLREMEVARQEMKRQAFERVFLRKYWIEWSEDKQRYDCVIGLSDPACAEYNKMWDVWQAAQEQMLQAIYQEKVVCAIESIVQDQVEASGVKAELHRLDGEKIVDSIAENIQSVQKREGGYYIRDLRRQTGNSMRFWYQSGYGTKHKNFFWCATLEEAKKYQGGCEWFEIWHAPYIDSLAEYTVDFQLADRSIGLVNLSK